MHTVLVVVASRHGSTMGIGDRIAEVLRAGGLDARLQAPEDDPYVEMADAVVIGSAVYLGSWLKSAVEFVDRNAVALAARPVWLFSSGPLLGSSRTKVEVDPLTDALGPASGPGSRGHQEVDHIADTVRSRGHAVFLGAFQPGDAPRTMTERVVRLLPMSKGILPAGDFRQWDVIDAWARDILRELSADGWDEVDAQVREVPEVAGAPITVG